MYRSVDLHVDVSVHATLLVITLNHYVALSVAQITPLSHAALAPGTT